MIESKEAHTGVPCLAARARLALVMLTVALSACGGGGGSPAPTPAPVPVPAPTPTPSLAVSTAVNSAFAGGQAIALHATVAGSSATPAWTLDGPGTLSASTGTDVSYTPPDTESLDDAATAKVSVSIPSTSPQIVQFALTPVDLPGHHWTSTRTPGAAFTQVVYGNGSYVTVGQDRSIWRSADGITWTSQVVADFNQQFDLVSFADVFMAVTRTGSVYTSVDGAAWTLASTGLLPSNTGGGLVGGNHVFVRFGGDATEVSADAGLTWTNVAAAFYKVLFGDGFFMADDTAGKLWTSADALHWTLATPIAHGRLAFAQGAFGTATYTAFSMTADGQTWISTSPPPQPFVDLLGAGPAFFGANEAPLGWFGGPFPRTLFSQSPGNAWQSTPFEIGSSLPDDIAYGPQGYVGVSSSGWIMRSDDGASWTTAVQGSLGNLDAVDDFGGTYVAVSDLGWALSSTDGQNWTHTVLPLQADGSFMPALALAHGNGVLVATGGTLGISGIDQHVMQAASTVWLSTDGRQWRRVASPAPGEELTALTFDGHRFFAPTSAGNVYASADGAVWALLGSVPGAPILTKIAYGGGHYVAIGRQGVVAQSADGAIWSLLQPFPVGAYEVGVNPVATMTDVLWDGHQFVTVGGSYTEATSTDGVSWRSGMQQGVPVSSLALCGGLIVGVGFGDAATSVDGWNWHTRLWTSSPDLSAVTCGEGRVVATGWNSAIMVSDH